MLISGSKLVGKFRGKLEYFRPQRFAKLCDGVKWLMFYYIERFL